MKESFYTGKTPGEANDLTPVPEDATHSYTASDPSPGLLIGGRYTLEQKLGEGGMGEVWVAKQSEPVKRKVALKLIKAGMDSKTVLLRFEQERQALALMDHPNIAKVLDGGLTTDRRPFFIMELVNGLPLTRFCDDLKLGIRERLELFVPICQGVQHAHQKGIVHRDLKPSNILVTMIDGKPVPKIIDFGVAKATSGRLTEESLSTQFGAVVGTFEYMSPEQAGFSGQDVDTRSDLYSLGVILYELLTGLRPIDSKRLKEAALTEMIRIIQEEEPSKPSTRLSTDDSLPNLAARRQIEPKKLTALLRGDLDWVVMKCLEKQRDRRYETANGLAREIERYLADEPVEARPPSTVYSLQKFIARHKGQVIAASLVLMALLSGICGTTWGLWEAKRQEQSARDEATEKERQRSLADAERKKAIQFRDKALEALRATTGVDVEKLLGEKKELTANEKVYLEAIAQRWQSFAKQEGTDEQSRAIQAEGYSRVALLSQKLGRQKEAQSYFEQALLIYEKLVAEFPATPSHRWLLACLLCDLGKVSASLGMRDETEKRYQKGIAILENLVTESPEMLEYREQLVDSHYYLGNLLIDFGRLKEAEEHCKSRLAILDKLTAEFTSKPKYRELLAICYFDLGILLADQGNGAEAELQYQKGLSIQERLVSEFPAYHQKLDFIQKRAGVLLRKLGKRAETEEQYRRKEVSMLEKWVAEFPSMPEYRHALAGSHYNLGYLLIGLGKRKEAEEHFRKVLAIEDNLITEFPTVAEYRRKSAQSHDQLAILLGDMGKRSEAEAQFKKGIATGEKLAADFPAVAEYRWELSRCHTNLGVLLAGLKRPVDAEEQFKKGLAHQEKMVAEFPAVSRYRLVLGGNYCNLGHILRELGNTAESLAWYEKAINTLSSITKAEPRNVAAKEFLLNSYQGRAIAKDTLKKHAEAVKDWDQTVNLGLEKEQPAFRLTRAISKIAAGYVEEAVRDVTELRKLSGWNRNQLYDIGCIYSIASEKIPARKAEFADAAMELLRLALNSGFRDVSKMAKDPDLMPLRNREDFRKLMTQLEQSDNKKK